MQIFRKLKIIDHRKKHEEKETQKEEFYISQRTPEGMEWIKVIAEPFTKYGVKMFVRYKNGNYFVLLAEVGMKVVDGKTKTECIDKLKKFVDGRGKETFLQMVKDATDRVYKNIGINLRYELTYEQQQELADNFYQLFCLTDMEDQEIVNKKLTEQKLASVVIEYWHNCILKENDRKADGDINDLLEEFVRDCKVSYHYDDLYRTVLNLTNSQKRKLYQKMINSGILER